MASVFVRIKEKFRLRLAEWVLAVQLFTWGVVLLLPSVTFEGKAFAVTKDIVDENVLGVIMLIIGTVRLGGLIINGALINVTPWVRMIGAIAGFMVFTMISVSLAMSGVVSTWIAAWPVAAFAELINVFRAAQDANAKARH